MIKRDYHIHTAYLKCANETMNVPDIAEECINQGVTSFALSDHLNRLDQLPLHKQIFEDMMKLDIDADVYFAAELNFTGCDEGFILDEETKQENGFQFLIGGIHGTYADEYDLDKIVEIQHRHHLKACEDPVIDVMVHPYWFGRGEYDTKEWPWFDTMEAVPESFARELGQTAKETGTAVEINGSANLSNPNYGEKYIEGYFEYLSAVAEEGALFSPGSDAHAIHGLSTTGAVYNMIERLGLSEEQIWEPSCEPILKRKS